MFTELTKQVFQTDGCLFATRGVTPCWAFADTVVQSIFYIQSVILNSF